MTFAIYPPNFSTGAAKRASLLTIWILSGRLNLTKISCFLATGMELDISNSLDTPQIHKYISIIPPVAYGIRHQDPSRGAAIPSVPPEGTPEVALCWDTFQNRFDPGTSRIISAGSLPEKSS